MHLILKRISFHDKATLGVLMEVTPEGNLPLFPTLEPPWNNNEENISCVPSGIYECKLVNSPKFGRTFEITSVENRTDILFHAGNYPRDTKGCVLLGMNFWVAEKAPAVNQSKLANESLMKYMELNKLEEFTLTIKNPTDV